MSLQELLKLTGSGVASLLAGLCWLLMTRKLVPGSWADEQIRLERESSAKWEQRYLELVGRYIQTAQVAQQGVETAKQLAKTP